MSNKLRTDEIEKATSIEQVLDVVMNALFDISGSYSALRHLKKEHLTEPLRKSMELKALTDKQIEDMALDVWEAAAIKLIELKKV